MAEYLTRCPACRTKFELTEEQMNARAGRVRCGECQEIFQADENLIGDPAQKDADALTNRGSVSETNEMQAISDDDLDDLFNEPLAPNLDSDKSKTDLDELSDDLDDAFSLDDEVTMEFDQLTGEFDATMNPEAAASSTEDQAGSEDWLDSLLDDDEEITTHTDEILNDKDLTGFLEGIGANTAQFSAVTHKTQMTHDMSVGPVKDRLKELERRHTRKQPAVAKQVASGLLWGLLCVVAVFALLAQLVYFKFDTFAKNPAMTPVLQNICLQLGCDVPKALTEHVTINELAWQPADSGTDVTFTVGNTSGEQMLLPNLKVELYNGEQIVGGNVLTPPEFLSASYSQLPSSQPIDGHFNIASAPAFDTVVISAVY